MHAYNDDDNNSNKHNNNNIYTTCLNVCGAAVGADLAMISYNIIDNIIYSMFILLLS